MRQRALRMADLRGEQRNAQRLQQAEKDDEQGKVAAQAAEPARKSRLTQMKTAREQSDRGHSAT